jgi:hypothetical protein
MKYKFFVYCPEEKEVIDNIILAASKHGAGIYGNYSHIAHITHGEGNWKSEKGAHPYQGKVGEMTKYPVAKIEMMCPASKAKLIEREIRKVHPWERVDIEFFRIEEL